MYLKGYGILLMSFGSALIVSKESRKLSARNETIPANVTIEVYSLPGCLNTIGAQTYTDTTLSYALMMGLKQTCQSYMLDRDLLSNEQLD